MKSPSGKLYPPIRCFEVFRARRESDSSDLASVIEKRCFKSQSRVAALEWVSRGKKILNPDKTGSIIQFFHMMNLTLSTLHRVPYQHNLPKFRVKSNENLKKT